MGKKEKRWVYTPKKSPIPKVPEAVKVNIDNRASELIETFLKPTYIAPPPENAQFNYLADISSKWYRNYFYFCNRYNCPGPNAIKPYFDDKFARMEYLKPDSFNLSYMRHTGKMEPVYYELTLEECFKTIQDDPLFHP